ncbi:MAG: hypothetical protein JXA89_20680 [Anaerolineae bacterium]|nr:hypothetical protein [Anaerolineae bacterium]
MAHDDQLAQLIRTKYPFPISHTYTYMENRVDPNDRYQAVMACYEVMLKTIASVALANFMHDVQEDTGLGNNRLFQDLLETLSRPLSLGHWHNILRLTVWPYHDRRDRLLVPELFEFYYRVTESGNVRSEGNTVRLIQHFIEERNEEAHHRNRSQVSSLQRQIKLEDLEQDLHTLLQQLQFLADYELFYVEHAEYSSGQWHYRANQVNGSHYPFRQTMWQTAHNVNSHRCLLKDKTETRILDLHPFLLVTSEGRLQQPDIFFFDGVFSSGKACFMSHYVNDYIEPANEGSSASVASDVVHALLNFLRKQIPVAEEEETASIEETLSAIEVYRQSAQWSWEHGQRQSISLTALREILKLTREEALQQERALDTQRGIEVEREVEVPFEGDPNWANLAYYVLDTSDQEEMLYRDIAAEAARLRDQYDPDWQMGDSSNIEATMSNTLRRNPRFYKIRRGYYRLAKHNELLSNPSWANLACFVLQYADPDGKGMHVQEITDQAIQLKEKYSDWHRESTQTPANTVSATMSVDHRFESLPERGYWRLARQTETQQKKVDQPTKQQTPSRNEIYKGIWARLEELGTLAPLPFGRTYFTLEDKAHFMFRASKAHHRNNEIEYFLGVTPQYFERIRNMGYGFIVFVLGSSDNALIVPAQTFAEWVDGIEPSGSGIWPMGFYQSKDMSHVERWVPGAGREDVSVFLNDYHSIQNALQPASETTPKKRRRRVRSAIHVADLLKSGLLKPGDQVHTQKAPDRVATVIDAKTVKYEGRQMRYNDWGMLVTGWASINIYLQVVLARTGQTLDELREELRERSKKI